MVSSNLIRSNLLCRAKRLCSSKKSVASIVLSEDSYRWLQVGCVEDSAHYSTRTFRICVTGSLPSRLRHTQYAPLSRRMVESLDHLVLRGPRPSGQWPISHRSRGKSDGPHNPVLRCRTRLLPHFPCHPRAAPLHLARHAVGWWD